MALAATIVKFHLLCQYWTKIINVGNTLTEVYMSVIITIINLGECAVMCNILELNSYRFNNFI